MTLKSLSTLIDKKSFDFAHFLLQSNRNQLSYCARICRTTLY